MKCTLISIMIVLAAAFAAIAGDNPRVEMDTTKGKIILELAADKAPKTVKNFLTYVDAGYYNGTIFHRVIPNFMIQGGGFTVDMKRKEARAPIDNEADNGLRNERGTIAMARTSNPHSATAQFFVNVTDNAFLNHQAKTPQGWGYTVFGQVTAGMAVVDTIRNVPTGAHGPFSKNAPDELVVINSIRRAQ